MATPRLIALCAIALVLSSQLVSAAPLNIPSRWRTPGIAAKDVPQIITFTHDDNTDPVSLKIVTEITRKHANPNGCKINAAFYTYKDTSDCASVRRLYNIGHEIAGHSVTHVDLHQQTAARKKAEIYGVRRWLINTCRIPGSEVRGWRSPFLSDDPAVRRLIRGAGYHYDSSIPEVFPSPTSPSATKRTFPYSLYKGTPVSSCKWFGNINHCTSTERHRGLFEVPLYMAQTGPNAAAANDLMDITDVYANLKREFDRNYAANRAPVGIYTHTSTGYLKIKKNRTQISRFLIYALAKPGVWVLTPKQLVDWVQAPVPASKMAAFMAKYKCSKTGIP